jgi:hypothetical protein
MAADSYTLPEVAEILGVSQRTLQRRIQEGAFPGRFIVLGRHGPETRLPADEVERALQDSQRRRSSWDRESDDDHGSDRNLDRGVDRARDTRDRREPTLLPAREVESLVPYASPEIVPPSQSAPGVSSALTQSDLELLRDAMLAIVREDREMFLSAVRDALMVRDREILGLRHELADMRSVVEGVRDRLEVLQQRLREQREHDQTLDARVWSDLVLDGHGQSPVDVEALLREIQALEQMLGEG